MQPDAAMEFNRRMIDLENWSVYRMLPQIIKYDVAISEYFNNIERGIAIIPSYEKERNQPSLWTYYKTLP